MRDHATTFLAILAAIAAIYVGRGFLLPIFLAIFLAIVLRPAVSRLHVVGIPEVVGAAVVVVAFLGLMSGALYALAAPLQDWADRLPRLTIELQYRFRAIQESIEQMRELAQEIEKITQGTEEAVEGEPQPKAPAGPDVVAIVLDRTQSVLITLLTTLVMLFFLLSHGTRLSRRAMESMPVEWVGTNGEELLQGVRQEITTYLRTFTLVNIALGIVVWGAMELLGLSDAVLWGALAGALNFLPYVGPLITVALIGGAALLDSYTWTGILLPPIAYLCINIIEGNLITPHILGRTLTLNPIAIFVSVLFWTWAWGGIGALLAVPTLAILRIVTAHIAPTRRLARILQ